MKAYAERKNPGDVQLMAELLGPAEKASETGMES